MKTQIRSALLDIEQKRDVEILFAIESGSRAWGFESTDSDFDVRFVYIRTARDYLTVFPQRDVIENSDVRHPDPLLDFSGWDFRKFLGLVSKSNPCAFEWMQSPEIYQITPFWEYVVAKKVRPFFSPKAAMHHYLSMARHNYREHMRDGESATVRLKKYLYIARPLLCCRWIELRPEGGPPPMPFEEVLDGAEIDAGLRADLLELVQRKKAGDELNEGPAVRSINQFIDTELRRLREVADKAPIGQGSVKELDDMFQVAVGS